MDYIENLQFEQLSLPFGEESPKQEYLLIPSSLLGFHNTDTTSQLLPSGRKSFCMNGMLDVPEERSCPSCGSRMHINQRFQKTLKHLPVGNGISCIKFEHVQYLCPDCGHTHMQEIPFQSEHHRITKELEEYIRFLLGRHTFTNKEISELSGVGQNIVKAIDKRRLEELYVEDGKLRRPDEQARFLGIDEFKLHNGHKYATHIINMKNGHILWIAEGKKKQVVYDFIEHVGMEWMSHVEAVALDMNSDFQEAFEEKCPHLRMVFDYFHIVKNFNDKVVGEIRKDEQKRLIAEGDLEAAKLLKHSKYIVTSSRETLARKDREAKEGRVLRKKGKVFSVSEVKRRDIGYLERYESILQKNRLLFTADLIKELLREAYASRNESRMQELITKILDLCANSGNKHMEWFWRLLVRHFDGIISHATYHISAGKIEGINNKIKTLRRQAYGYPDDEYFFLKLIDMSRH